ncbi:MAG: 4-hydroxy-3-methylbut-2-enyl diphosphate reductase [Gammaproteobacteria bacterium]
MEVLLANPRGFCAGVDRAIEIVECALKMFGAPIYVRHEVVHNKFVVNNLKEKGAIFVDELNEVPDGSTVIFSAHGVSKAVQEEAKNRDVKVFDATCPLVTKVHLEVVRYGKQGLDTILIGHKGHPEVEGTMGQYDATYGGQIHLVENVADVKNLDIINKDKVAFVTQTTLSVDDTSDVIDALKERFPTIIGPKKDDICYATQNRQDAVKKLVASCDLLLVIGSKASSNSNRLREIADKNGIEAHLIDGPKYIQNSWLNNKSIVGVTAGASAPEILVQRVIQHLKEKEKAVVTEDFGKPENIVFPLPKIFRENLN